MNINIRDPKAPKRYKGEQVWIVQHDESPDNTILGVFATDKEAYEFMETVKNDYADGVILSSFPIGFRATDGVVQFRSGK